MTNTSHRFHIYCFFSFFPLLVYACGCVYVHVHVGPRLLSGVFLSFPPNYFVEAGTLPPRRALLPSLASLPTCPVFAGWVLVWRTSPPRGARDANPAPQGRKVMCQPHFLFSYICELHKGRGFTVILLGRQTLCSFLRGDRNNPTGRNSQSSSFDLFLQTL